MYRFLTLAVVAIILTGCSALGGNTQPVTPGAAVPPPSLSQDAADCGIAVALAGVTGGVASIAGAIAATPSCARLPGDVLAQIQGTAVVKATAARRALRLHQ